MRPARKLRAWLEKRRAQQQQIPASQPSALSPPAASPATVIVSPVPASAQASTSSAAPAPVAASGAASHAPPSNPSIPATAPPLASALFPFMHVIEHPDAAKKATRPRLVYVSLSAELRLLYADSQSNPPASLVDFRGADICISLARMPYEPPQASAPPMSLEDVVAQRVRPETHPTGRAVRIADQKCSILLIAATDEELDALLSALRLRVAPWPLLRQMMETEIRAAAVPSASAHSLAEAARELLSGAGGAAGHDTGSASGSGGKGAADVARVAWEKAGLVAQTSLWAATFGKGLGGVVRTAEELEKLSKPLGALTVVGCAFSLMALSARAVSLMGIEREGREKLAQAREDLRDASVSLVGWLFSILSSGFDDEDGLVGKVFDVLGECWDGADELEKYLLHNWAVRTWKAEEIGIIASKVESVTGKLFAAGLLNIVAKLDLRVDDLEGKAFVADDFRSYAPSGSFDVGLVSKAATSLAQLTAAVLPTDVAKGSTGAGGFEASSSSSSLRRVALTSVNGEGGVGKTSTCKLLCVDEEVRAYFSDGAIGWLDFGKGATEEKVKGELRSAVLICGGYRSAELMVASSCDVKAAVDIARLFFARRRVLVIVDNVCETPSGSIVTSWAEALSKIVSGPGSAVVIATRFVSLSRSPGFSRVKLGRLGLSNEDGTDWRIAETLYDAVLNEGTKVQSSEKYKKSRGRALVLSCGLPLAITTFAGLVHRYCEIGDDVETVLANIEKKVLGLADQVVGEDLKASTGHPGLFAAMKESLSYLDQRERIDCRVKPMPLSVRKDIHGNDIRAFRSSYDAFAGQALSARYTAMEVMLPSSTSVSFPLLCRLWHVSSILDAKSIALLFVNMGLGRIEGGEEKVFVLHDLQYAFCTSMCGRPAGASIGDAHPSLDAVRGHAFFLSSCESLLDSDRAGDNSVGGWSAFCFSTHILSEQLLRGYLGRNLLRHICAAAAVSRVSIDGYKRTIMSVLSDFGWIRSRIDVDGRSYALEDCIIALASRSCISAETKLLTGGAEKSIRALQQSLMLIEESVLKEGDGALAGSLIQLVQSSDGSEDAFVDVGFRNELTCSAERTVRGPWVKPIIRCSPKVAIQGRDQGVLVRAVVGGGGWVFSVAAIGNGEHFVSGSADGVVRLHERRILVLFWSLKDTPIR